MSSEFYNEVLNKIKYLQTLYDNSSESLRDNPYFLAGLIEDAGFFESKFYINKHKDVGFSESDPSMHYIVQGYRENRLPGKWCAEEQWQQALSNMPNIQELLFMQFINKLYDEFNHLNQ